MQDNQKKKTIYNKNEPPNSQIQLISQLIQQKDPESNDISMLPGILHVSWV